MKRMKGLGRMALPLICLAALAAVPGCGLLGGVRSKVVADADIAGPVVTGTATYRERMKAPTGSVLKVELSDTSRADAPAISLADWSISLDEGGVPHRFTLKPGEALDPRLTYTVRATITGADGALLWTTDTVNRVPVSAERAIDIGEIVMVKVPPSAPEVPVLAGSAWVLEGLGGVGLVSGREPTLAFSADGRISGTTGCNRFFGSYTQDGAALTFSGAGMTKMACMEPGLMQQESAFAAVLNGAATASVDGLGQLTVTGASGKGFVAKPAALVGDPVVSDPVVLQGAEWVVEDLNRGGVIDNTRLTLAFSADGKVSGSTNCNRFNGTYTATGNSVSFGPLAMTRRACLGEGLAAQERKYMDALGGVMTWAVEADGALVLTGDDGKRVLLRR